jgi:transposase
MARKKYRITLSDEEQQQLTDLTRKGKTKAREFKRAMILLKANEGLNDPQIMAALNVSRPCVERIRKRYVTGGLDKALHEDPRPGQKRKLDGRGEAHLIAMTCTPVPEGYEHWELRLLADKLVEQGIVESISYETVRQVLKKTNSNPGKSKCGVSRRPAQSM